jgi:hypothetical protein
MSDSEQAKKKVKFQYRRPYGARYRKSILRDASEESKLNRNYVLETIRNIPQDLEYAKVFQNDMEVVLEAVKREGDALEYASQELKNNKIIILRAITSKKHKFSTFKYASSELKNDKEFVLQAIKVSRQVFRYCNEILKTDRDILLILNRQWDIQKERILNLKNINFYF